MGKKQLKRRQRCYATLTIRRRRRRRRVCDFIVEFHCKTITQISHYIQLHSTSVLGFIYSFHTSSSWARVVLGQTDGLDEMLFGRTAKFNL